MITEGTYKFSNGEEVLTITNADGRKGTAEGTITVAAHSVKVDMWYHYGNDATTLGFCGGTGGGNSVHVGGTIRSTNPNQLETSFSLSTNFGLTPYTGTWDRQ